MDQLIHLAGAVMLAAFAAAVVVFGATIWAGRFGPPRCYSWMLAGLAAGALTFGAVTAAVLWWVQ
jgi:hypothetical protein